jgi:hypothetical protein
LAGRVRFAMSHASGKVEILGVDRQHIYTRYHRSKYPENRGQFMVLLRDDNAFWLDQLRPAPGSYVPVGVDFGHIRREPCLNFNGNGNGQRTARLVGIGDRRECGCGRC